MSTFTQTVSVSSSDGARSVELEALVDTGSSYLWVPRSLLIHLGVEPIERRSFQTADKRSIEREVGEVRVTLQGRSLTRLVVFGDDGSVPLMGADVLEGFGLAVDPLNHRLTPVPGLVMSFFDH